MNEHLLEPFKPLTRSTKLKNKNKWCKYHGTSKPHCADGDFGQVIPFDKRDETTYKRCSGTCKYKETDWLPKKNKGRRDMFSTDFQVRNIHKKKNFPFDWQRSYLPNMPRIYKKYHNSRFTLQT